MTTKNSHECLFDNDANNDNWLDHQTDHVKKFERESYLDTSDGGLDACDSDDFDESDDQNEGIPGDDCPVCGEDTFRVVQCISPICGAKLCGEWTCQTPVRGRKFCDVHA